MLIDMPLDQLKTYQGRNPRPADFDDYWNNALNTMNEIDPKIELVKSDFQVPSAECFDLWFTGVDNARIHAQYLRPKNTPKKQPAIIFFHGYSGNAGDWSNKLQYLALGYSCAALDCRGQGGLSEDTGGVKGNTFKGQIIRGLDDPNPHKLLFRNIYLDTAELTKIVSNMPEVDPARIGVIGGSQGGGLALACASLSPNVKKVVSFYPFLSDYKRVWEMDLAKDAYDELKMYFRFFDPQHKREDEIFTKLGYIDVQHLAPRIKGHVRMVTGMMDTICPPSSQFAAYNKITSKKEVIIYPDFGHENLAGANDETLQFMLSL
ncbi:MAG: acetylesterase [Planctomycetes bacterium GWF2_41_51]|nr:MAG: acetylesterase [Planctomycetes bacterium GWF2_41_51]HBG26172.1 acetylesterase [Phycisphaerales bacterium]